MSDRTVRDNALSLLIVQHEARRVGNDKLADDIELILPEMVFSCKDEFYQDVRQSARELHEAMSRRVSSGDILLDQCLSDWHKGSKRVLDDLDDVEENGVPLVSNSYTYFEEGQRRDVDTGKRTQPEPDIAPKMVAVVCRPSRYEDDGRLTSANVHLCVDGGRSTITTSSDLSRLYDESYVYDEYIKNFRSLSKVMNNDTVVAVLALGSDTWSYPRASPNMSEKMKLAYWLKSKVDVSSEW